MRTIAGTALMWVALFLSACASGTTTPYPQTRDSEQTLAEMQFTRNRATQEDKLDFPRYALFID